MQLGWGSRRLTIVLVAGGASIAAATPLTPFRYEAQAQRHCPGDTVVWLDFRKGIYYAKRQKFYGGAAMAASPAGRKCAATAIAARYSGFGKQGQAPSTEFRIPECWTCAPPASI